MHLTLRGNCTHPNSRINYLTRFTKHICISLIYFAYSLLFCDLVVITNGRKKIASSILRPQGNSRADRQWKLHHPAPAGFGGRRTMIHQGHRREHTGGSGARDDHHVQDTAARGHHSRPEQWYLGLKSAEGHDRKPVNSVEVHPLLLWCWCEISFCKVTRQSIPTNLQALFLSSLPLNPRQYFIESVNFLLNW